jgi:hypothetical protein
MKYRCLTFVLAMLAAQSSNAADPEFMDFVLKNAHERGFTRCDAAIKEAFSSVGGSDIRVITKNGLSADSMKIVAVYGKAGDSVYSEAEFRRTGAKCTFTLTTTLVSTKSCTAELGQLPAFKFEAETVGVTFTKNAGGVNMLLVPVGTQGCTSIFLRDGEA